MTVEEKKSRQQQSSYFPETKAALKKKYYGETQLQSGVLLLVQIQRDTVLWLVETMVLLRQLSYAIKNQLKEPKAPY